MRTGAFEFPARRRRFSFHNGQRDTLPILGLGSPLLLFTEQSHPKLQTLRVKFRGSLAIPRKAICAVFKPTAGQAYRGSAL